jgi:hypothetical protein
VSNTLETAERTSPENNHVNNATIRDILKHLPRPTNAIMLELFLPNQEINKLLLANRICRQSAARR